MRAALEGLNLNGLSDAQKHCIAAGAIARRCSITEAMLAGVGKEIEDAFGPGDAEWSDLTADRKGLQCARKTRSDAELSACCVSSGPN